MLRYADWMGDFPPEVDSETSALVPVTHDLAEQIADMRAHTMAGLRAKAEVPLTYSGHYANGEPMWTNHD